MRLVRLVLAIGIAVTLVGATQASAAVRYASAKGKATKTCSKRKPCSLTAALTGSGARAGDVVVIEAGQYRLASQLAPKVRLTVTGPAKGQLPVITSTKLLGQLVLATGSKVDRLELVASVTPKTGAAPALLACSSPCVYDDLMLVLKNSHGQGVALGPGDILRDSVIASSKPNAIAVTQGGANNGTTEVRNLTIELAGASSIGLLAQSFGILGSTFNPTIDAQNVIIGVPGAGAHAVEALNFGGGQATVEIGHSNFNPATESEVSGGAIVDQGGNQTTPPGLTAAFRERPGSVTIQTGIGVAGLGTVDLACHKISPSKPDIGAYQFGTATARSCVP